MIAQEPANETEGTPASEKDYHDLRRSKNRTIQRFAERYSYLVRTQEWTSLNGKSKVMARYVSHTPDLKQVTLAVVKGSGANRATREVAVNVDALNKVCQSRIRQIDAIKKKLDELVAKEEEDENAQPGAEGSGYGEYGAPMTDERGADPAPAEEALADAAAEERGANEYGGYDAYSSAPAAREAAPPTREATPQAPAPGSEDPDPLGFGEIANETPPVIMPDVSRAPGANPGFLTPSSAGPPASAAGDVATVREPGRLDPSQWKTNYAAFHANFTATPSEQGEPTIDWGQLGEVKAMHDAIVANEQQGLNNDYGQVTAEGSQRLGEVTWEGVFLGVKPSETGEPELQFDLPPLPEPLRLRFVVAPGDSVDAWATLRPGQPVKFVGRLDIKKPREILVQVRKAE